MEKSCLKGCFCSKAFTLIELLVVVLIVGILAAVAVPQYQKAVLKSRTVEMQILLEATVKAVDVYYLTHGTYPVSFEELDLDIDLPTGENVCLGSLIPREVKRGKNFQLALYDGGIAKRTSVGAFFTTEGKYKCAGFIHHFTGYSADMLNKSFCVESYYDREGGAQGTWGAFCTNVMGTTFFKYNNLLGHFDN